MVLKKVITGALYFLAALSAFGTLASLAVHFLAFFGISLPGECVALFYGGLAAVIPALIYSLIDRNSEKLCNFLKKIPPGEGGREAPIHQSVESFIEKVRKCCPSWLTRTMIVTFIYVVIVNIPGGRLHGFSLTPSEMTVECVRKSASLFALMYLFPFVIYYSILRALKATDDGNSVISNRESSPVASEWDQSEEYRNLEGHEKGADYRESGADCDTGGYGDEEPEYRRS